MDSNGQKLEADLTLEKVDSEHGKQVAHLKMVMASAPQVGANAPIAVDVDAETGMLIRLEVTTKGAKDGGKRSFDACPYKASLRSLSLQVLMSLG